MVKVVPGQEKTVYNALQEIDGIKDVYHVFGEFDFVVIIEVEGLSMLNKLMTLISGKKQRTFQPLGTPHYFIRADTA